MSGGPLAGVRIVDMTMYVSGPLCTQLLAGLGAEVIKVERPPHGDVYRLQGPDFIADQSISFLSMNKGKKSIVLDLKHPEAREVMEDLLRTADVFVHNFKPGTAERLGLGKDDIRAISPRIIWTALSGYGGLGPRGNDGGYDLVMQGELGLMAATGFPDRPPAKAGFAVVDIHSAALLALGVVAALHERDRTGVASTVESSLYEVATSMGAILAERYLATGKVPSRRGAASSLFSPYEAYQTADGYVTVGATGPPGVFRQFCEAIGTPELADSPDYVDNAGRVANQDALRKEVERQTRTRPTDHWVAVFTELGMPSGAIRDIGEALEAEQTNALDLIVDAPHSALGSYRTIRHPLRVGSDMPGPQGAPLLGEHTRELLQELGRSHTVIDDLAKRSVIITSPVDASG
ncbi:MAG: CoA transferase [Acidimicrobiia bacterium]|nr:CoA transferase [Acidimicrobiia bacterium]